MERHYTLPIGFAAAFHAALLFGFSKMPRSTPPIEPRHDNTPFVIVREEPEIVPASEADSAQRETAEPLAKPVVTGPELTIVPPDAPFIISRPPMEDIARIDTRSIPAVLGGPLGGKGEGGWGPAVLGGDLDNPPRTRFQPSPIYPYEGKKDGLHGEVWVEFRVDESGRVHEAHVVRSSHRMFEEPTLRAVSRWQFEPGRKSGRIVSFRMSVPVIFSLTD